MSFRPVAEFGHPPETGFLIQCRCLEVMGGHPDFLNAASRRLPNKGAEQIPRMTLSTMGLVNPHLPDLGCARPGVAHGSTNDATFAITHHETQCTAVIPTYAGACAGIFRLAVKPGVFSKAPILFIHGDADDYTPIGPCQDYADKIGKAGTPVEFAVIEGAHHKFDSDDLRRYTVRGAARTRPECPLETDIDTSYVYDRTTWTRLQGPAFAAALKGCGAVGATVEGNIRARDKAAQAAVAFLKKTFGN